MRVRRPQPRPESDAHQEETMKRIKYLLFVLAICLLAEGCSTSPLLPVTEDFTLRQAEQRLWLRAEEEQEVLEGSGIIYEDQELENYLLEIVERLQPPEVKDQFTFRIKLIKDPFLNAFAFPNGVIYLHTGILARLENEAQLAALLAHELTHCTHRHALRAFSEFKNQSNVLTSFKQAMARLSTVQDLLALFGATGSPAAINGYSQAFETEADIVGLALMAKAGYEPTEALKLFEHLKHEVETEDLKEPFFFGTHPRLQGRIENCRDFLDNLEKDDGKKIKNREVFLEKTHRVILYNASLDLKAGRFGAAQRGAAKYLTIRADDPKAYFLLGEIFRQKGDTEDNKKARFYYEKAIALNPSYTDAHKAIGLIYFKEGAWKLAQKSFETSLSLSPQRPDHAYIQRYLQECNTKEMVP